MKKDTSVRETFQKRLSQLRAESGLSQSKLARQLGISPATVGYYENGDRLPDIDIAARIARFFGVSIDYLTGFSNARSTEQDMKTACEVTGLSEKAIENIKSLEYHFSIKFRKKRKQVMEKMAQAPVAEYPNYQEIKEMAHELFEEKDIYKKYILNTFFESLYFSEIMDCIYKAYLNKIISSKSLEKIIRSGKEKYEDFVSAIEQKTNVTAYYKVAVMDVYELVKKFVDTYAEQEKDVHILALADALAGFKKEGESDGKHYGTQE